MSTKDILYIVMPAYNEQDNIEAVVRQWYPVLEGKSEQSRLVIADAGSVDCTHEIICTLQKTHPQLEYLSDTKRQHGPKVIALYDYAMKKGADFIFQTDSDGQTSPEEFSSFWEKRQHYDAVIGQRPVRGDGKARAFVEKVVCFLLRLFFGIRVSDANAPYRLMRRELVEKYLYRLPSDYNIPNIMMTTYFVYYKETVCFEDITFQPRTAGKNSVNIPAIIKIGLNALKDFARFRKEMEDSYVR